MVLFSSISTEYLVRYADCAARDFRGPAADALMRRYR